MASSIVKQQRWDHLAAVPEHDLAEMQRTIARSLAAKSWDCAFQRAMGRGDAPRYSGLVNSKRSK
jgi:hypothetical protein